MNNPLFKNKLIEDLENKLEHNQGEAVNEFSQYIQDNGTPLIEEIEGDNDNSLVTFIYSAEKQFESVLIFTSFLFEFASEIEKYKLKQIKNTNLWYITFKVMNDIRYVYTFIPNECEEIEFEKVWENKEYDKFNEKKFIWEGIDNGKDLIYSYVEMPKSKEDFWIKERIDINKGTIENYKFESINFNSPRNIDVYIPHEYNRDMTEYKFIVFTDGTAYTDKLSAKNVLDNLIADKKIPPVVSIFVDSESESRREELRCSDKFCAIIVNEILPWIRKKYKISNNPEDAIIAGLSLGGLTASYMGLKHSDTFGNIISQSGSYWYIPVDEEEKFNNKENNDCWMSLQFKSVDKLPLKFYIEVGIIENHNMRKNNSNLKDTLISKGYDVNFEVFKGGHDYLCWGENLANALISILNVNEIAL